MLIGVLVLLSKGIFNKLSKIDTFIFGCFISVICSIQALYGILQWLKLISSVGRYQVVGSFDNPAGFAACLCAGLPFIFLCLKEVREKKTKELFCYLFAFGLLFWSIVVSGSRSGVLTIAIVLAIWLYPYIPFKLKSKILISVCLILVLLGGGYFLKKDSADGRLLI